MIEVERKRQVASADEALILSRLDELGYQPAGTMAEIDTYYSRPDVDFIQTVECLRVRQRDGFAEVTYKPASTAETHSETGIISKQETNLILRNKADAEIAQQLLANLGMVFLARVEKSRITYQHPTSAGVSIMIDVVTNAGTFIETEVTADDAAKAAALLEEIEIQLGITESPMVSLPYRDLVLQNS
ncbi:adenylate cyclase, class 2 [Saccharopolyspora antimicrobica]|uniref:Adenylate cyclase n=1 Tax=Saccharopolyspora antimicrobica TaxID=455193 RepID=A0A1I4WXR7_9PSEU|nr:class IV adenylate cyclase [Saccharopolyspora antimicrobica]RKT84213.1 adenylate cyclase [Saccharopolyspora antimicrobica]SFN18638.1 adenylate cyclase, class 2 [Saccharopolyspora antimicrobica]